MIQDALDDLDALLASEEDTVGELDEIIASIGTAGPRHVVQPSEESEPAVGAEAVDEPEQATQPVAEHAPAVEVELEEPVEATSEDEAEAVVEPAEVVTEAATPVEANEDAGPEAGGDYLDELEFLESLSLGDSERFDAVSAMLDDEEEPDEDAAESKTEDA